MKLLVISICALLFAIYITLAGVYALYDEWVATATWAVCAFGWVGWMYMKIREYRTSKL